MVTTFFYNNKTYTTDNLERKLEKLGITIDDIKICKKQDCRIGEPEEKVLYRFYNPITKETIVSIYEDLEHLRQIVKVDEFTLITDDTIL